MEGWKDGRGQASKVKASKLISKCKSRWLGTKYDRETDIEAMSMYLDSIAPVRLSISGAQIIDCVACLSGHGRRIKNLPYSSEVNEYSRQ